MQSTATFIRQFEWNSHSTRNLVQERISFETVRGIPDQIRTMLQRSVDAYYEVCSVVLFATFLLKTFKLKVSLKVEGALRRSSLMEDV